MFALFVPIGFFDGPRISEYRVEKGHTLWVLVVGGDRDSAVCFPERIL